MEKRKLLLVDDEPKVLDSLKRMLRKENYELILCANAPDALQVIADSDGDIDLVLADNKMPGLDGTDLLIVIGMRYPNIVRIMLTGNSSLEDAQKAINKGKVYKFLTKPCNVDELKLVIRHALAHKDLWSQNRKLLKKLKEQEELLGEIERKYPGVTKTEDDELVIVNEDDYDSLDSFMKRYFG